MLCNITHPLLALADGGLQVGVEQANVIQGVVRCKVCHLLQCDLLRSVPPAPICSALSLLATVKVK